MAKYKITILEQYSGNLVAEIVEHDFFPTISSNHCLLSGGCGVPVKIEMLMEASEKDTRDMTEL